MSSVGRPMKSPDVSEHENYCSRDRHACQPLATLTDTPQDATSYAKDDVSVERENGSRFIKDLLAGLLASATDPRPQPEAHNLSVFTPPGPPLFFRPSEDAPADRLRTPRSPTITKENQHGIQIPGTSSCESASSSSDSDNDTKLLTTTCEESDREHGKDALPRTKHEQDENKIHVPRPIFVATEQHTLVKVGTISAILDNAVIVTTFSLTEMPPPSPNADIANATALDTGSLLCFSDGTLLGAVFETFGPVASPMYVVRFNNSEEIPSSARAGVEVMYVEQEMNVIRARDVCRKGYDASGKDDEEVDAEEFSDDEKERRAKKLKRSGHADRSAGPLKRKRGFRERQRQGRSERAPFYPPSQAHNRTWFRNDDNERHWASQNTPGPIGPTMRQFSADALPSFEDHVTLRNLSAATHPTFISRGPHSMAHSSDYVPPRYPVGNPVTAPSEMNSAPAEGPIFNSSITNTDNGGLLRPSPFPTTAASFPERMMPMAHQPPGYPQFWAPHANCDQYRQEGRFNSTNPPYLDQDRSWQFYQGGPSHPYPIHEHYPPTLPDRNGSTELHNRELLPCLDSDAASWQGAPRQYGHM